MVANFNIELIEDNNFDLCVLRGNIDIHAEKYLQELPGKVKTGKIKLDFSEVGRINSMGIGLLLRCFKKIRDEKEAEVILSGLNTMHTMLFKTTGVFLIAKSDK
ncbi:MAG TPA: STAS domain-containing protein [Geobacteraceae bacterium]|nr:STAS domain-containing protein [Geobacteraceae bacterium]